MLLEKLVSAGDYVLELGCGPEADNSVRFLELGCFYCCIDMRPCVIKNRKFSYIQKDFRKVPLPRNRFNLIYGRYCFHYDSLPQTRILMNKLYNSLASRGRLWGIVHSSNDKLFFSHVNSKENIGGCPRTFSSEENNIIHFYTRADVKYILRKYKIEYIKNVQYKEGPHEQYDNAHKHSSIEFLARKK